MEEKNSSEFVKILVDHNIEGLATMLWDTIVKEGWLEFCNLKMLMFSDVGLSTTSNDREVWTFAQHNHMILLTANRNMEGKNSLEQTLREKNTLTSLPVITIASEKRLKERKYREQTAESLLEKIMFIENYRGTSRIFIP
jgi:predicted nuclease of predicted toxin-antitoxin system